MRVGGIVNVPRLTAEYNIEVDGLTSRNAQAEAVSLTYGIEDSRTLTRIMQRNKHEAWRSCGKLSLFSRSWTVLRIKQQGQAV